MSTSVSSDATSGPPGNPSDPTGSHDWFSDDYVTDWIEADGEGSHRRSALQRVAERLPFPVDDPIRVLDVGAGFGALTACVLSRHPAAHVVMADFSRPMLDRAHEHLGGLATRTSMVEIDLRDPAWGAMVQGPFDAIVSSIAIHNVRDTDVMARIYRDLCGLLRPGGFLADFDIPRTHTAEKRVAWLQDAGFIWPAADHDLSPDGCVLFSGTRPVDAPATA